MQFDAAMQEQAQAAADAGQALRYVGSLDLVDRKCTVALKVGIQACNMLRQSINRNACVQAR